MSKSLEHIKLQKSIFQSFWGLTHSKTKAIALSPGRTNSAESNNSHKPYETFLQGVFSMLYQLVTAIKQTIVNLGTKRNTQLLSRDSHGSGL